MARSDRFSEFALLFALWMSIITAKPGMNHHHADAKLRYTEPTNKPIATHDQRPIAFCTFDPFGIRPLFVTFKAISLLIPSRSFPAFLNASNV